MEWKNKYLKYKSKYIELKNTQKNILYGGDNYELSPDEEEIFSQIYDENLKNDSWNKKSILLDCIKASKMQTQTIKFIKYLMGKKKITPTKKQLEIVLIFSVFCGYYLIVEELIRLGANPNINYGEFTLVDTAIDFYFNKTAKILMSHGGLSKKYYSHEQLNSLINFSNDPENYLPESDYTTKVDNQIYLLLREKLILGGKYNFENLSRNISKIKLKKMINNF